MRYEIESSRRNRKKIDLPQVKGRVIHPDGIVPNINYEELIAGLAIQISKLSRRVSTLENQVELLLMNSGSLKGPSDDDRPFRPGL